MVFPSKVNKIHQNHKMRKLQRVLLTLNIFLSIDLFREGFNILVYGLGSKRYLIDEFRTRLLDGKNVIVVNGYFPGLTIKEIFNSLTDGILEHSGGFSSPVEQLEFIEQEFTNSKVEAYIIIHNMDGPSLQFSREQEILCRLAAAPGLHVVASTDHINTPLRK